MECGAPPGPSHPQGIRRAAVPGRPRPPILLQTGRRKSPTMRRKQVQVGTAAAGEAVNGAASARSNAEKTYIYPVLRGQLDALCRSIPSMVSTQNGWISFDNTADSQTKFEPKAGETRAARRSAGG